MRLATATVRGISDADRWCRFSEALSSSRAFLSLFILNALRFGYPHPKSRAIEAEGNGLPAHLPHLPGDEVPLRVVAVEQHKPTSTRPEELAAERARSEGGLIHPVNRGLGNSRGALALQSPSLAQQMAELLQ